MDPLFQLLLKHGGGGGGDAITTGAFIDIDSRESGMDPTAGDRKAVRLKNHLRANTCLLQSTAPANFPGFGTC
jgi:hypothetical protein